MPKRSEDEKKLKPFDLKAEREKRELNQTQVAEMLYVTQVSVSRWESEGNMPQIYRAYWELYWQVNKPKAAKKVKKPD